jgi:hypothetical protein
MQSHSTHPTARIYVTGRPVRSRDHSINAVFGREIVVDPLVLSDYCFRPLSRRVDDLLHVAAAVGYADRLVRRQPSHGWRRRVALRVAVHEPDFWKQPGIVASLVGCLDLVTGDIWSIEFDGTRNPLEVTPQAPLALGTSPSLVMPFSDGLDSLAAARLLSLDQPQRSLILVTSGSRKDVDRAFRLRGLSARRHRVSVPFRFSPPAGTRLSEPSNRSRGFVFGVLAGAAAYLLDAERVVLGESGQGVLGPWLLPVGNEAPDVRMHPMFTLRLTRLLDKVLGRPVAFWHPHLWTTKGETVGRLRQEGVADDWWETRSCARDQRHMSRDGKRVQCGVCAACLLRRQSLFAAGLDESKDSYMWPNLAADRIEVAHATSGRSARPNDRRQALCGVLALDELASLGGGGDVGVLRQPSEDLAAVTGFTVEEAQQNLARLLGKHRIEWQAFVAAQGPSSFLAQWMDAA